jgi:hypothetical protein
MRAGGLRPLIASKVPAIPWKRFAGELVTIPRHIPGAVSREWLNDRFERSQTAFAEKELRHEIMISKKSASSRMRSSMRGLACCCSAFRKR